MNRKLKRFLAILLSAAMVCGSSVMAFADAPNPEGNVTGDESEVEGYVETDVFTYSVPTASNNALKMILDPQKLISKTHAAAYEGYTESDFESNKTVYFRRYETGAANKFMGESDSLSACNLGTVSMNVTLSTEIENTTGITFVSDNATFASIKTPAVKFTFKTTNLPDEEKVLKPDGTTDKLVSSNGAEVKETVTISAGVVPGVENEYSMSVNKVNGVKNYTYNIPSANTATAAAAAATKRIAFNYAAEANDVKGWADILDANPKIKLTYKFEKWVDEEAEEVVERVMESNGNGGYRYDFSPVLAGTLTSMKIDGTVRDGIITAGNATYGEVGEGRFLIKATAVTNFGLSTGNHTVDVVIGGKSYTLKIKN